MFKKLNNLEKYELKESIEETAAMLIADAVLSPAEIKLFREGNMPSRYTAHIADYLRISFKEEAPIDKLALMVFNGLKDRYSPPSTIEVLNPDPAIEEDVDYFSSKKPKKPAKPS